MPAEACNLFSVRNVVYKKGVPQARNLTTSAILMHIKIVGAVNLFLNMIEINVIWKIFFKDLHEKFVIFDSGTFYLQSLFF